MSRAPHPNAPGLQIGIDEAMIRDLVYAFYNHVRSDEHLGPIFNAAVQDWDEHLAKLCDFWSSVVLMTGRYKGTPMVTHATLPAIDSTHFDLWLALFKATAHERCPPAAAVLFVDRAERIAQSLELGIALHRGQRLKLGERLTGCPVRPVAAS
jgi:hemoglobin